MGKRTVTRCRRYAVFLAALLAFFSCCTQSQKNAYQHVWALYTSGSLPEAADAAAAEADKFRRSGDLASFWQFRLLRAEALLAQGKVSEASGLISKSRDCADPNCGPRSLSVVTDAIRQSGPGFDNRNRP